MAGWAVWLALAGGVLVVVAPVLHRVSVLPLGPALLAVPVGILISLVALLLSVTVVLALGYGILIKFIFKPSLKPVC